MNTTSGKPLDRDSIAGELEAIADIAFAISNPLLEGDNRQSDAVIGSTLHAIGMYLNRIASDIADYVPGEGAAI